MTESGSNKLSVACGYIGFRKGMDPEAWGELFFGEKRCLLRREEKNSAKESGKKRASA